MVKRQAQNFCKGTININTVYLLENFFCVKKCYHTDCQLFKNRNGKLSEKMALESFPFLAILLCILRP